MEEIFHIFPTFFAWKPLLFHRILQNAHKMVHYSGFGYFFRILEINAQRTDNDKRQTTNERQKKKEDDVHRTGLARALSKSGYCSRSSANKLIRDGRVRLNGRVVRDPEKPAMLGGDSIEVDGQKLAAAKRIYLVMNKPRGVVTTA